MRNEQDIKHAVRQRYGSHATSASSCGCGSTECCEQPSVIQALGYDEADLAGLPEGADLGLGCGNPLGLLGLAEGETVLDLGSGAGIDCFLAAKRVGPSGRVIGVDMTPEMIDRARRNAKAGGYDNVEFRLGEIEHLPAADSSVDAIVSNCVINLVPDKRAVFSEAFRVLKPGGRLSVSDIVTLGPMPDVVRDSAEAYVACLSGAIERDDYLALVEQAGLTDVRVTSEQGFADIGDAQAADLAEQFGKHAKVDLETVRRVAASFVSIRVQAVKPQSD